MAEWWSIEVFDADMQSARQWKESYQDALTEAAVTHGASYWEWHEHNYGVVFEVLFDSDEQWEAFRALTGVRTAIDAVPGPGQRPAHLPWPWRRGWPAQAAQAEAGAERKCH